MKQFRTLTVALTAAVATTLGGGALVLAGPGTAGAVAVGDETALLAAFADAAETEIVLTADVDLTCGGGAAVRTSATPVVVDGQGHTITQTCAETLLFGATGGGGVSVRDVTLVGGIAAIEADGPIAVTSSRITGQTSATGPVAGVAQDDASMPVTITDSVIDTIATTADGESAYGSAGGLPTVTRSSISGITSPTLSAGISGSGSAVVASTIRDLSGGSAAGVYSTGPSASVTGSTIAHLTASVESAVAVFTSGDTVVDGSRITDLAGPVAAGVLSNGDDVTLSASTVAGVHGSVFSIGVVVENDESRLTVRNATVSDVDGPGIVGESVTVVYSTVRGNGGLNGSVGDLSVLMDDTVVPLARPAAVEPTPQILVFKSLTLFASAVVDPEPGMANCDAPSVGAIVSVGYNFVDDDTCALTGPGDQQGAGLDPLLGGLDENGGLAPTFLPQSGSPLLDAIPLDACQSGPAAGITTDERSEPRPSFLGCDIGAVEVQVVLRFTG